MCMKCEYWNYGKQWEISDDWSTLGNKINFTHISSNKKILRKLIKNIAYELNFSKKKTDENNPLIKTVRLPTKWLKFCQVLELKFFRKSNFDKKKRYFHRKITYTFYLFQIIFPLCTWKIWYTKVETWVKLMRSGTSEANIIHREPRGFILIGRNYCHVLDVTWLVFVPQKYYSRV